MGQHDSWIIKLTKSNNNLSQSGICAVVKTYAYFLAKIVNENKITLRGRYVPVCSHNYVWMGTNDQSIKLFITSVLRLTYYETGEYCENDDIIIHNTLDSLEVQKCSLQNFYKSMDNK